MIDSYWEAKCGVPEVHTASENIFLNMSDALEHLSYFRKDFQMQLHVG